MLVIYQMMVIYFLYNKNHIIMSVSIPYLLFLQKQGSSRKREKLHLTNVGISLQVVKELEIAIGFLKALHILLSISCISSGRGEFEVIVPNLISFFLLTF